MLVNNYKEKKGDCVPEEYRYDSEDRDDAIAKKDNSQVLMIFYKWTKRLIMRTTK